MRKPATRKPAAKAAAAPAPAAISLFQRKDIVASVLAFTAVTAIVTNVAFLQAGRHPAPIFGGTSKPVQPTPAPSSNSLRSIMPETTAPASMPASVPVPAPRARQADAELPKAEPAQSAVRPRNEIIADIQRELSQRGFYDGAIDGVHGPKTDGAMRDFEQAAGLKPGSEPNDVFLRALTRSQAKATTTANAQQPAHDPIAELIAPSSKRILAVQRALAEYGYGQIKPNGVMGPETREAIEQFERVRRMPVTGQVSPRLVRELSALTGRPLE